MEGRREGKKSINTSPRAVQRTAYALMEIRSRRRRRGRGRGGRANVCVWVYNVRQWSAKEEAKGEEEGAGGRGSVRERDQGERGPSQTGEAVEAQQRRKSPNVLGDSYMHPLPYLLL